MTDFNAYAGPYYLSEYFASLANFEDNPLGVYVRACVLNRLKVAVPGEVKISFYLDKVKYRDAFYKDVQPMPEQDILDNLTGRNSEAWGTNSIPYICDTIYNVTSDTRNYVDIDTVHTAEKSITALLNNKHTLFYRYLLEHHKNPTADAYAKLTEEERKTAKADYITALTNSAWINNKIAACQEGNWQNADWELYHHWNKIKILGASDNEVKDTINLLISKGLPVDSSINADNWLTYSRWITAGKAGGELTWNDFSDAREAMTRGTAVFDVWTAEAYSLLFMQKNSPGSPYWKPAPDTSCFSFDTMIRMADGSLHQI